MKKFEIMNNLPSSINSDNKYILYLVNMGRNFKWAIVTQEKADAYDHNDDEHYVSIDFEEEYDLRSCSSEIYGGTYTLKEIAERISDLAIKMTEITILDEDPDSDDDDYDDMFEESAKEYSDIAGAITAYSKVMRELARTRDRDYVAIIEYH